MRRGKRQFSIGCDGEQFFFARQTAHQQLMLPAQTARVLPRLTGFGMNPNEMYALACNCVLLWQVLCGKHALKSPAQALRRFSLSEIAQLARLYFERLDQPFNEQTDWDEESWVVSDQSVEGE